MDISAFTTQQTATGGKPAAAANANIFAGVPGLNFIDLILARLAAEGALPGQTAQTKQANSAVEGDIRSEMLSAEKMIQKLLGATPAAEGIQAGKAQKEIPAGMLKKLARLFESLLAGLPQESKNIGSGEPALIATGLTPEKFAQLLEKLEKIADGDEQGEGLIAGLIQILPPEVRREAIFLPRGTVAVQPQHPAGDIATPEQGTGGGMQDLAARLNALTPGADDTTIGGEESDFDGVLRVLERAQTTLTHGQKISAQGAEALAAGAKQAHPAVGAGLSTIPGATPALSEMFTSFTAGSIYPDGLDYAAAAPQGHGLTITGAAQFTSLTGSAPQAALPHPATQMVAATIAKASFDGESKNITIHLDPPELGKVSIRMEFGRDRSIKAHMVVDKPETYLMLQRDSHVLQRVLQDSGLDAGGNALSFELSQDGNMTGHDRHSTGGNSGGGGSASADDNEIEIIETHMDWYVDAATGLMRYDALV